jgi:trimeric autotransporter adhesin
MKNPFVLIVIASLWFSSVCAKAQVSRVRVPSAESIASEPLVEQSISSAVGRDDPEYWVLPRTGRFEAVNHQNDLNLVFGRSGIELRSGTKYWGIALHGYGYGTSVKNIAQVSPRAMSNRVEYRHGALTEWYVNGPLGLEQGFTIRQPPRGSRRAPLTLALILAGDLTASVDSDGAGLTLKDRDGAAVLRYSGLKTLDAAGKELKSSLEVNGNTLLLMVDDRKARYPVVVDPWMQQARLHASNGKPNEELAWSVSADGDTVVVGAPEFNQYKGEAYVFVKPQKGWTRDMTETARLNTSDGVNCNRGTGCSFGSSVAISGNTIVVGAQDSGYVGAAYVFVKPKGGWKTTSKFDAKLANPTQSQTFGVCVALSGDTAVVGTDEAQAAYVFTKPVGGWSGVVNSIATLTSSDNQDTFGTAVAIDGDTILVGAQDANVGNIMDAGAAYLFVRPAGGWKDMTQTAELTASDGLEFNELGWSVAINGDTAVAGAPRAPWQGEAGPGIVYVFVKPANGWRDMSQTAELTALNGFDGDQLGNSVSISDKTIAAGATYVPHSPQGAIYVYAEPKGGWEDMNETAKLTSAGGKTGDSLGFSVAISGHTIVGGAPYAYHTQGAAYVFGQR